MFFFMLNEKLNVCLGVKSTNTMQLNIRKDIKRRKPDVVFDVQNLPNYILINYGRNWRSSFGRTVLFLRYHRRVFPMSFFLCALVEI